MFNLNVAKQATLIVANALTAIYMSIQTGNALEAISKKKKKKKAQEEKEAA